MTTSMTLSPHIAESARSLAKLANLAANDLDKLEHNKKSTERLQAELEKIALACVQVEGQVKSLDIQIGDGSDKAIDEELEKCRAVVHGIIHHGKPSWEQTDTEEHISQLLPCRVNLEFIVQLIEFKQAETVYQKANQALQSVVEDARTILIVHRPSINPVLQHCFDDASSGASTLYAESVSERSVPHKETNASQLSNNSRNLEFRGPWKANAPSVTDKLINTLDTKSSTLTPHDPRRPDQSVNGSSPLDEFQDDLTMTALELARGAFERRSFTVARSSFETFFKEFNVLGSHQQATYDLDSAMLSLAICEWHIDRKEEPLTTALAKTPDNQALSILKIEGNLCLARSNIQKQQYSSAVSEVHNISKRFKIDDENTFRSLALLARLYDLENEPNRAKICRSIINRPTVVHSQEESYSFATQEFIDRFPQTEPAFARKPIFCCGDPLWRWAEDGSVFAIRDMGDVVTVFDVKSGEVIGQYPLVSRPTGVGAVSAIALTTEQVRLLILDRVRSSLRIDRHEIRTGWTTSLWTSLPGIFPGAIVNFSFEQSHIWYMASPERTRKSEGMAYCAILDLQGNIMAKIKLHYTYNMTPIRGYGGFVAETPQGSVCYVYNNRSGKIERLFTSERRICAVTAVPGTSRFYCVLANSEIMYYESAKFNTTHLRVAPDGEGSVKEADLAISPEGLMVTSVKMCKGHAYIGIPDIRVWNLTGSWLRFSPDTRYFYAVPTGPGNLWFKTVREAFKVI